MTEVIISFAACVVILFAIVFFAGRSTRTTRKTSPLLGVVMPQKKEDNNE